MIKFKQDTLITIYGSVDAHNNNEEVEELFHKGELVDAEILEKHPKHKTVDLEFGDGDIAFNVLRNCFTVEGR
jgi:(2Fe-2S) ferredoxin